MARRAHRNLNWLLVNTAAATSLMCDPRWSVIKAPPTDRPPLCLPACVRMMQINSLSTVAGMKSATALQL